MTSKLLQSIIHNLFPKNCGLISAFGYGSVVVPQHGRSTNNSQLDLILIVDDPCKWHVENLRLNPKHYSGLASLFNGVLLKQVVTKWPHPAVFFNPLVTWHDITNEFTPKVIKYGVVGYEQVMRDLNTWTDLYIAGRLHKPVVFVPGYEPPPKLRSSCVFNLRSALAFSLLQLDLPLLKEDALYHCLASISYRGDWRLYFGEDRQKIKRLVTGEPRRRSFRDLYIPLLISEPFKSMLTVDIPADLNTDLRIYPLEKDLSATQLLECIPSDLCQLAAGSRSAAAQCLLAKMPKNERRLRLQNAAASIVRWASYRQTVLGLFSAGLSRSFVYSYAKFRKMLASLNSR
uniref:Phosphatidate cytidylyltransferase, mitochondrial n=1 Tax=Mesocestoides corti TaxID=53468 RepID=A0A5K3FRK7_MESCO